MQKSGRVYNSIKNGAHGIMSSVITSLMGFIVRTVFVMYLDKSYLGVSGLFSNILTMLSLVDLGFSTAIIHSLYKPIYENDNEKINILITLFRKIYAIVGFIVAAIGVTLIPFLGYIIKDTPDIPNLNFIYCLYLLNSVFSYFFAYRRAVLSADQKEFVNSKYRYYFTIIKSVLQIISLVIFADFIVFLLIQILCTLSENIFVSRKIITLYPYLRNKSKKKLDKAESKILVNDIKALIWSRFGFVILNGTDNIIISAFVNVVSVGFLSNYTLITSTLASLLTPIINGITGGVGNYIVSESSENRHALFKKVDFAVFWLYSFSMIAFFILVNPFITLWIGNDYLLQENVALILGINFFIEGIVSMFWMFRSTLGLFTKGKYRAMFCAIINIVISLIFVRFWGVFGVLFGTTLSRLLVNLWYDPIVIFKYGLNTSSKSYFISFIKKITLMAVVIILLLFVKEFLLSGGVTIIRFILLAISTALIPNIIYVLIYRKKDEFKYFCSVLRNIIHRK